MINILHNQIKEQEKIIIEKDLLIKNLKEDIKTKTKIINLQNQLLFKKL